MNQYIQLHHGDGGRQTSKLIKQVFYKHFDNPILMEGDDAAALPLFEGQAAFTTDSFVVKPIFFKGGDIGKLAICGTINDLTAAGAYPKYISTGFMIEEGFDMGLLDQICYSMGQVCRENNVVIVTGDTKVVERGSVNGIFINTAGIGIISPKYQPRSLEHGDEILITGGIAEHGTVILSQRYNLEIEGELESDCNPLSSIIDGLGDDLKYVKLMRDPTRGGLGTAICDISASHKVSIVIDEIAIPVHPEVVAIHKILGTDPLYFPSEGRMIIIVKKGNGERIRQRLAAISLGTNAKVIGMCIDEDEPMVKMRTKIGGGRIITALDKQMIPRIC